MHFPRGRNFRKSITIQPYTSTILLSNFFECVHKVQKPTEYAREYAGFAEMQKLVTTRKPHTKTLRVTEWLLVRIVIGQVIFVVCETHLHRGCCAEE